MVDLTSARLLLALLAGWLSRRQQEGMAYLIEENRIPQCPISESGREIYHRASSRRAKVIIEEPAETLPTANSTHAAGRRRAIDEFVAETLMIPLPVSGVRPRLLGVMRAGYRPLNNGERDSPLLRPSLDAVCHDRETRSATTEVVEHRLGAGEGPLRIHDPGRRPVADRGSG